VPNNNPSGLSSTAAGAGRINLSWTTSTDNVDVGKYFVERCQALLAHGPPR